MQTTVRASASHRNFILSFLMLFAFIAIGGQSWGQTLIAGWDFQTTTNGGTACAAAPSSPTTYIANFGSGTIYFDGTNGSSTWTTATSGNELTAFSGTTVNAGTSFSTTTTSPAALAVQSGSVSGSTFTANGKKAIFKFSMTGYTNLVVSYATQRTSNAFTTQTWEYSTDGTTWTTVQSITSIPLSFATNTLSTITALNNVATAYLRLTFTGATATSQNNRLDNIQFNATSSSGTVPTVSTTTASAITTTTASSGGTITATGGLSVTAEGVVWNTSTAPTIANSKTSDGTATTFTSSITGLSSNTLYYYRAYATNSAGTGYASTSLTFTTLSNAPAIGTASAITSSGFTANWSAPTNSGSESYTYSLDVATDNAFTNIVVSKSSLTTTSNAVTGLSANTTYYYRVKAVNAGGNSAYSTTSAAVFTLGSAPANDLCGNATTLTLGAAAVSGTTVGATTTSPFTSPDVWYSFTATSAGTVSVTENTSAQDLDLTPYLGGCPTAATSNITSTTNNGTSLITETVSFSVSAGTTYYIRVAYAATSGSIQGSFTIQAAYVFAPVVTGDNLNYTAGVAITPYQVQATNSPTSYAVQSGSLPSGLNLTASSGVITGTPSVGGSYTAVISATNVAGTGTATFNFTVTKQSQTITFNSFPAKLTSDTLFPVGATASSGLALTYTSSNEAVATVTTGGIVQIQGATGSTTITASQSGNGVYTPATSVSQVLTVSKGTDLLAAWDFQTTSTGGTAVTTVSTSAEPVVYTANKGAGTLYLNGTNGSSTWSATTNTNTTEVNAFSGSSFNTVVGITPATTTPADLVLQNSTANGKKIVFSFSMTAHRNLEVTYVIRATSTGFTSHVWEYSTDGTTWTTFQTVDVSSLTVNSFNVVKLNTIAGLNFASTAYLRLTVTGASSDNGNNGLDNIRFNAASAVQPAITTNPSNVAYCMGTATTSTFTVAASGSPAPTYQWQYSSDNSSFTNVQNNTPAGFTYANSTMATLSVTTPATAPAGIYYYRATATNELGSVNSTGASLTINPLPTATISYVGSPYCATGTATVTQTGGTYTGTYSSTTGLLFVSTSTGEINLASSTAGTYTVTYTFSNGTCTNTVTTQVTINALPTATISGPSSAVCAGSASGVTITNTGTTTETINYTTQISGGTAMPNSIILTSGSGYQPNDVVNSTTTYTITSITNGTCTSSSPSNASVTVTVNQAPVVALISGPGNIAFGKKGTYTEATPGGIWSIVSNPSGDATITSTSTSPDKAVVTAGSSAGTATLSYTVTDGTTTCSTKTDTTINIFNNTITRYRTKQDGYATDFNTWSVLNDNNVWVDATTAPTNNDNIIVRHNLRLQYANYKGAAGTSFDITSHDTTNHVTINGTLTLADTVYFQSNGSVNFNGDSVILLSSSAGTGSIGVMGAAIAGATNVTVQRYTDGKKSTDATGSRRAWRLITSPVTGQTIRQSWQEGGVSTNGYGTLITGEQLDPATAAAQGYDYIGGGNHTSLKHYVIGGDPSGTGGNYWLPLSNTGSTTGTLIPIQNEQAYLLFVRGDRTVGLTGTSPATLRSTGTLQQGDGHAVALTPNSLYTLVGNPYASAIDFGTFIGHNSNAATGIQDKYYSWNSTIGTYGSYVLVDHLGTGGNYEATPVPLTNGSVQQNDNYRFITNGSGFFVLPNSPTTGGSTTSPGSVSFKETDKAPGMVPPISPFRVVTPANERQLLVNLSQKDSDTSLNLADGFRARFSDEYSGNEADNSTAKAANPSENLGLVRSRAAGESDLIIEARADVQKTDTLYMKMWNVSQRSYQLQVQAAGFTTAPGVQAWLQDSYLGTKQAVDLAGGVTSMDFTVTADSGSWRSDRFMIVFTNSSLTLPVTVTKVKAAAQNGGVSVAWTVTNETNIRTYQAEKSADGGITFTAVGTPQAARNNAGAAMTSYSSFDSRAAAGDNLYRIRIEAKDGTVSYSQTVKVTVGGSGTGVQIVLYPNPVRQGRVSVQLTNLAAGTYLVSVYTSGGGQAVYQKKVTITQAGTTQSEELLLGSTVAQGSYEVKITNHNGAVVHQQQLIVGR